eukprot:TRINITY_DN14657_c0_g1_i1.p1 TRINITY_DN14657_c0_g1~~TRINITY_DN14657_c0_g1_i1.p1  ORF type:complete len:524 (-),score=79.05 TRINITY_DN14657_c0_g1_i1:84-1544(-)
MRILILSSLLLLASLLACGPVQSSSVGTSNLVKSLPGLTVPLNFTQYTGYVPVGPQSDRNLFYWFVEAESDTPEEEPLVLWLTGGPGCSGLFALLTEHGPFRVHDDGETLYLNDYSWNKAANMIYIEAPCGVGFSYGSNASDPDTYVTGDNQTASDNLDFIEGFLRLYPQFQASEFFIAGESYGGHYVPELAYNVMMRNEAAGEDTPQINLRGIMAGNPSFDFEIEEEYTFSFVANHALISQQQLTAFYAACGPNGTFYPSPTQACSAIVSRLLLNLEQINPYNIYAECIGPGPGPTGGCLTYDVLAAAVADQADLGKGVSHRLRSQTFVPCIPTAKEVQYMTSSSLLSALNVSVNSFQWDVCSSHINYTQYAPSMFPYYHALIDSGNYRFLIYSGDVDSCVPFPGTEECVRRLNLPLVRDFTPWTVDTQNGSQVAGYQQQYAQNVSYVTVKGAGHMVPTYKPLEALALFSSFLTSAVNFTLPSPY